MQFRQTTILGLFDSSQKHFIIPVYQRAYSWDKEQWNIFLSDLKEQIVGDNNYFYGIILLETIEEDIKYEIIDGQQRLTTLIIFIRALINTLKQRKDLNTELDYESKEKIYLKNCGNIKLRTVDYDRAYFEAIIVDDNSNLETATLSQIRIKDAKKYFISEFNKLNTDDLLKILKK